MRRYSHINWALSDQALVSGANFVTGILLARYLGIAEFGRFTIAWLVLEFALNLQGTILTTPMLSIGAKKSEADAQRYFGAVIVSQLSLSLFCSVLLYAGVLIYDALFYEGRYAVLALPLAIAGLVVSIQQFLRRYAFARSEPFVAFASDATRYALQLGILIWLFQSHAMNASWVLVVVAGTAFAALVPGAHLYLSIRSDRNAFKEMARRHWDFSKWLVPSTLLNWAVGNLFIIAAGAILGAAAVGSMKAAQNIVAVSHIFLLGLENIAPISAARRFYQSGGAGLIRYLQQFALFGGIGMGLIVVAAAIMPDQLLQVIYGSEFEGQGYLVRWWCFIYLFVFFAIPPRIGLRTLEYTRPIFVQNVALSIFSVAIFYPVITTYGMIGVMMGLAGIQILRFLFLTISFRRRVKQELHTGKQAP